MNDNCELCWGRTKDRTSELIDEEPCFWHSFHNPPDDYDDDYLDRDQERIRRDEEEQRLRDNTGRTP